MVLTEGWTLGRGSCTGKHGGNSFRKSAPERGIGAQQAELSSRIAVHANGQRGEVIGQIREKEENSVHTVTMTVALSIGRSGEEETDEA